MDYACPECRSENTQSVRMAIFEGALRGNSRGMLFGIGIPGALGFGWTSAEHELRNGIARKYMLPPEPSASRLGIVVGVLIFTVGLVLAVSNPEGGGTRLWVGLFCAIGMLMIASDIVRNRSLPARREEWSARLEQLRHTWICRRCGHEWARD